MFSQDLDCRITFILNVEEFIFLIQMNLDAEVLEVKMKTKQKC